MYQIILMIFLLCSTVTKTILFEILLGNKKIIKIGNNENEKRFL